MFPERTMETVGDRILQRQTRRENCVGILVARRVQIPHTGGSVELLRLLERLLVARL